MPDNLAIMGAKITHNTKLLLLVNTVLGSKCIAMPGDTRIWGNRLTPVAWAGTKISVLLADV